MRTFTSPTKIPSALLEKFCWVPSEADAVLTEGAWARRRHQDLAGLSRAELLQQKASARLRLAFEEIGDPPSDALRWLTDRVPRVDAKLQRRG